MRSAVERSRLNQNKMVHDVSTQWNSTADLVQQALELSPALIVKADYNKPGHGVHLKCFQLSLEEWKLLMDLSPLLDVSSNQ